MEARREGAGYKGRVGGLMFVEPFGFVEEVFIVRLAAVFGVRPISCVRKVLLVARFYVFSVGWWTGGDVGSLWAGLVFTADLLVAAGVSEVN
jgi:hypothetical protein